MAAKKVPVSKQNNASDFIRSQPVAATAPDVVAAGKRAGFDFSASLVYAVRGRMKKSGRPAAAPAKRPPGPAAARRAPAAARRAPAPSAPSGAAALGGGRLEGQIQELVTVFVQQMATLVRRAALDAVREALGRAR